MEKLNHNRIVKFFKSEQTAREIRIYMEYMAGGSIRDQLELHGAFGEQLTRHYTKQILEGLVYLHGEKLIHRDIKGTTSFLCIF